VPPSITETLYTTIKTRLETILTDSSYSLNGTLRSVQLKTLAWAGGERPELNTIADLPTIIVSDISTDDSSAEQVDTWTRTVTGQCWFVSTDGDLLPLLRAYEDMLRALDPAELPKFNLAGFGRSYVDAFGNAVEGVLLTFTGTYRTDMSDPTVE
jgi:hypothetical protein